MTIIAEPSASTAGQSSGLFLPPAELAPQTKARAADINAISAAVGNAFDKLPTEVQIKGGTTNYAVDTGSAPSAYVVALDAAIAALADGLEVVFRSDRANLGAATLNVNGVGAVAIRRADGSALQAGDIVANSPVTVRYSQPLGVFIMNKGDSITRSEAQALLALGATPSAVPITSLGKGPLLPGQVVRLNAAGTALEGADVAAGTDLAMVHAINLSF